MYDPVKKIIYFPHTFPGNELGGRKHQFSDINDGAIPIADAGLVRNMFLGGNCVQLGLIGQYGFYACPSMWNNEIMAFHVTDGQMVTEEGRRLLEARVPAGVTISYDRMPDSGLSQEEIDRRNQLRKTALEVGIAANMVSTATADEMKSMIEAMKSGAADKPMATVVDSKKTPVNKKDVHVKTMVTGDVRNFRV